MSATTPASKASLLVTTLMAAAVAAVILVMAVLPAEYGFDPTGVGGRLGLTALSGDAATVPSRPEADAAVIRRTAPYRSETLSLPLAAGAGIEIKSKMRVGERFVFSWTSEGGPVEVDFHGERPDDGDRFTSYWAGAADTAAHGSFEAPFDGVHGWYWKNNGPDTVTVKLSVSGYFDRLFVP